MSALLRVAREDAKKSIELITNIIYIFFCFSNYTQFHAYITQNKVGDMCLKLTDTEITRVEIWRKDLKKLDSKCEFSFTPYYKFIYQFVHFLI